APAHYDRVVAAVASAPLDLVRGHAGNARRSQFFGARREVLHALDLQEEGAGIESEIEAKIQRAGGRLQRIAVPGDAGSGATTAHGRGRDGVRGAYAKVK